MARPRSDAPVPELHLSPVLNGVTELIGPNIGTRERLILLTVDEIRKTGPSDFNARVVCERLGVKQSMIPYHFGSRDGLIAEATIWAYRDWARFSIDVIRKTTGGGEKRLRAYLNAEIEWASRMGTVALLVQYPMLSEPVRKLLDAKYGDEMRRQLEYHLAVLSDIVVEIRTGKVATLDYDVTNYPGTDNAIKNSDAFLAAASISWASHGISMWSSGHHMPSQTFWALDIAKISTKFAINHHIDEMVAIAKGR